MASLAKGLLFEEKIISMDEVLRNLEAVTADDVARVTRDILVPSQLTTTALGAVDRISSGNE